MGKNLTYIKLILGFLIIILAFFSCEKTAKKKKKLFKKHDGYTITGTLSKGNVKYIYLIDPKGKKIDSSKIKKHSFSLQGKIGTPNLYYLKLKNIAIKHPIVLENSNYKMLFNGANSMIIGGNLNSKFSSYQYKKINQATKKSLFHEQLSNQDINLRTYLKRLDSIHKIEKNEFNNFILQNEKNILSSIILKENNLTFNEVTQLKALLQKSTNKDLYNELNTITNNLKITETEREILRRKTAPLFTGINLLGSKTSLKNLIRGKKAFLIDFWASWCPPCRETSPKVIELYEKYSSKGFDVLTVSEDRSVADWKNGIYVDGIESWHHIYDDFNRISSMYYVTSLPHMILIDENGKIIKNKISLKEIETELKKIFNE